MNKFESYLLRSGLEVASGPLGRLPTSCCPELTLIDEGLFILLMFEVFVKVFELHVQPFLLNFSVPDRLVKHVFVLLPEVGQLDGLLGSEGGKSSLHFFVPLLHPLLFFFPLHLEDLLLDFVGFCESK